MWSTWQWETHGGIQCCIVGKRGLMSMENFDSERERERRVGEQNVLMTRFHQFFERGRERETEMMAIVKQ